MDFFKCMLIVPNLITFNCITTYVSLCFSVVYWQSLCVHAKVINVEWVKKEMREVSFTFLFNKFKRKYLHWLLPDFFARDIYAPVLGTFIWFQGFCSNVVFIVQCYNSDCSFIGFVKDLCKPVFMQKEKYKMEVSYKYH